MTFEEYAKAHDLYFTEDYESDEFQIAREAWDAAYHQAIQDIIDYAEHMGDVEKFARQHGIRVEEE